MFLGVFPEFFVKLHKPIQYRTMLATRLYVLSGLLTFFTLQLGFTQEATFDDIYDLFQIKCTACHGGASPQGALDLSGTKEEFYNSLVGVAPVNPAAASKGYQRVMAGYPSRSFLLQKLATSDWDSGYELEVAEGNSMPPGMLEPLAEKEIELVRQWILFGAPKEGTVVDPQLLEDYYENGLALPSTTPLDPPSAGEGFQLELGPFFLGPLEELEFYKKHKLKEDKAYEVDALDISFNDASHHFILYKMDEALAATYPEGLRNVENTEISMIQNTLVAVWQNEGPYSLPEGTAYRMREGTQFDLNYHLKNYNVNGVLAGKVYINIYTQEIGTAQEEMFSQLFPVSLFDLFLGSPIGSDLIIPNDEEEYVFTEHLWIPPLANVPFPGGTWHIWQLSTHTHARGVDYDIYLSADGNGTKGEQIFEGFYNFDYTFDQGYYDWEHPPIRYFDPLLPVNMDFGGGLVHEAKYINDGPETLYWGNSVDDEMMLIFIHFTLGEVTSSLNEIKPNSYEVEVFPNPVSDRTYLKYQLEEPANTELAIYDLQGKVKWKTNLGKQTTGIHQYALDRLELDLASGIYFLECAFDGEKVTQKMIVE